MTVEPQATNVVDAAALREEVKNKYREVAADPHGKHHFHTGRYLANRLGYDDDFVGSLPDVAVESFAGVANPFALRSLMKGERVSPRLWLITRAEVEQWKALGRQRPGRKGSRGHHAGGGAVQAADHPSLLVPVPPGLARVGLADDPSAARPMTARAPTRGRSSPAIWASSRDSPSP